MKKRKKPKFLRQGAKNLKRLRDNWRKPRGSQSKQRKYKKSRGPMPNPGYGSLKAIRGLHPSGFEDVLVYNPNELEKLDSNKQACRIASTVGKKKRFEIMRKASEMKIKVLNPLKTETKKDVKEVEKK
jgi:large subunit ribosomal protein L32e